MKNVKVGDIIEILEVDDNTKQATLITKGMRGEVVDMGSKRTVIEFFEQINGHSYLSKGLQRGHCWIFSEEFDNNKYRKINQFEIGDFVSISDDLNLNDTIVTADEVEEYIGQIAKITKVTDFAERSLYSLDIDDQKYTWKESELVPIEETLFTGSEILELISLDILTVGDSFVFEDNGVEYAFEVGTDYEVSIEILLNETFRIEKAKKEFVDLQDAIYAIMKDGSCVRHKDRDDFIDSVEDIIYNLGLLASEEQEFYELLKEKVWEIQK